MHYDKLTFNVVLHGLFLLYIRRDHIELLTPSVHDHVYYAGDGVKTLADLNHTPVLRHGEIYTLVGVNQFMECPPITHHCNTLISLAQHGCNVEPSRSHFIVRLPFPYDIMPARTQTVSTAIYAGRDAATVFTDGVSLCQVLVYPVMTFQDARLWGTNWKPPKDDSTPTLNLHIWAEPTYDVGPIHAKHAYPELMKLIPPLELDLVTDIVPKLPTSSTGIPGVDPEDLKGLAELPPKLAEDGLIMMFGPSMAERIIQDRSAAADANGGKRSNWDEHGSRTTNCQAMTAVG